MANEQSNASGSHTIQSDLKLSGLMKGLRILTPASRCVASSLHTPGALSARKLGWKHGQT